MTRTQDTELDDFLRAQEPIYDQVCAELGACCKRTHWMWFIFPQLRGLGRSPTAWHYGIRSLEQAQAYLEHPVLGARLRECTRLMLSCANTALPDILPPPDHLKFRSSMTLFGQAAALSQNPADQTLFAHALTVHCQSNQDPHTLALLNQVGGATATECRSLIFFRQ